MLVLNTPRRRRGRRTKKKRRTRTRRRRMRRRSRRRMMRRRRKRFNVGGVLVLNDPPAIATLAMEDLRESMAGIMAKTAV